MTDANRIVEVTVHESLSSAIRNGNRALLTLGRYHQSCLILLEKNKMTYNCLRVLSSNPLTQREVMNILKILPGDIK